MFIIYGSSVFIFYYCVSTLLQWLGQYALIISWFLCVRSQGMAWLDSLRGHSHSGRWTVLSPEALTRMDLFSFFFFF